MKATHKQLRKVLRRVSTDYEPYGTRSSDERGPDCSCGCKWFHLLEGERGADWGVCFNIVSPRAGLLTFEHQGCPYYEDEDEDCIP